MPTITVTRIIKGEMQPKITLVLNGAVLPHTGEKITIEQHCFTVRQVFHETAVDKKTGDYYICSIQMTVDDEQPKD